MYSEKEDDPKAFVPKLSDSEAEAAETQCRPEFSLKCNFMEENEFYNLYKIYDK